MGTVKDPYFMLPFIIVNIAGHDNQIPSRIEILGQDFHPEV
jgi:hypothetical protein